MTGHIPIVDFSAFSIAHEQRPAVNSDAVQELAKEIYSALSTVGFVYLTKHGISVDEIDHALQTTDAFFNLSSEVKTRYQKKSGVGLHGWDEIERERLNPDRPGDLKESFDIGILDTTEFTWPSDAVVPNFKSTVQSFFRRLQDLGFRVMSAIAIALNLDPDVFKDAHKRCGTAEGCTHLRFNYYPNMSGINVKPGQIRCGEHTDYGSITLLIQDDVGGLEVCNQESNEFVPATPIPGTILVNIADLMQRWTSDRLKSTYHRVTLPEPEKDKKDKPRRSIVFFFFPDSDALITCLDGSDKYPPVKAGEYLRDILHKTYKF